jgi:hypothetical protein
VFLLEGGKWSRSRFGSRGCQAAADGNAASKRQNYKDGQQTHEPPHASMI